MVAAGRHPGRASLRVFVPLARLPQPDTNAGDRRFCEMLALLARTHRVDVCLSQPAEEGDDSRYAALLRATGVRILQAGWHGYVRAQLTTRYHLGLFYFFREAERFAADFRRRQPAAVVVVDSVDVHFARLEAGVALGVVDAGLARDTKVRELAAYRAADAVIVVSDADAELLRTAGGIPRIVVVPLIVAPRPRPVQPRPSSLLFVGNFQHPPNVDGLCWFLTGAWPRIRAEVPEATLEIIGTNPPAEVRACGQAPGVAFLGYVPEVAPFLDRTAVSVAPLRYGGGVKGKIVEAMAAGVPVVTTRAGVQGLPLHPGRDVLMADDEAGFADAVVSLLRDPVRAAGQGAAGQRAVAFCAPEAVGETLEQILRELVPRPEAMESRLAWLRAAAAHAARALRARLAG